MPIGHTIKIDGLGVFSLSLGFDTSKASEKEIAGKQDSIDGYEPKLEYRHVCIKGINFRPDPELLREMNRVATFENDGVEFVPQRKSQFSREERLAKAKEIIDKQGFMTLSDYAAATGLSMSGASKDLRQLVADGDSGIVAGMTVFVSGKPLKRDYRKFRMKETQTQNDYASMHEAVSRRIQRYLDGDEKFSPLPDLLLIDGGAEHATVAQTVLEELNVSLPVFGMVKDDRHRTRALITPGGHEIGISGNQAVFSLIGTIQEETHRYSIEYQRSLRNASLTSQLDQIPGVGQKRRNDLLKAFRSVKAVKEASLEQLKEVVPKNTAEAVYEFYHKEE